MRLSVLSALVACSMLAAVPARAVDINFAAKLTDQDDKPIIDGDKVLTLGRAAMVALMTPQIDEQQQPVEEKLRKGDLALRAYRASVLEQATEISIEDVALIKKYIGKTYGPLVVVRAFPLLDPKK